VDVLTRLTSEHDTLRTLLERIQAAAEARDATALAASLEAARPALTDELDTHIAVEEAEVFASAAASLGEGLLQPFYEEHVEIRQARGQIYAQLAQGAAPFDASLRLCELVLAHQQREDLMLFPSAREAAYP
jgi:hemerythrin-like domain-containing protein